MRLTQAAAGQQLPTTELAREKWKRVAVSPARRSRTTSWRPGVRTYRTYHQINAAALTTAIATGADKSRTKGTQKDVHLEVGTSEE